MAKEGVVEVIGNRIHDYLRENGITQISVARKTGIKKLAISNIANEKRKITAEEYYRICKVLNLPLEYFFHQH